ncbi:ATP synthase F1 subunit delta [Candidatus Falkowbacteria bacterium]|nr:ATP synthase F1 subunit delta [Candidatus Falkowbacteria bacterium]
MKVSTKQYAKALLEATYDLDKKHVGAAVDNFILTLRKNNDLGRAQEILADFSKLWNEADETLEVEVVSAHELDHESKKDITGYAKEVTGAKEVILKEEVNADIIAGFVLRSGDKVYDASIATKLKDLKKEIAG